MQGDRPATDVPWHQPLYVRLGARHRLRGIRVFYDFPWTSVFSDERTQFRNGLSLANGVLKNCPAGKTPALLLTRDPDTREGSREHPGHYLVVVNIDRYLQRAGGDAAATYFSTLSTVDPISAATIDWSGLSPVEIQGVVKANLSHETIRDWVTAQPDRVARLLQLVQQLDGGVRGVVAGREREAVQLAMDRLGDQFWRILEEGGIDIPDALAHRHLWKQRRRECEDFRAHLEAGDWTEPQWQKFFEQRTWIFGYGLDYRFLHQIEDHPFLGGTDVSGAGGQEGDFLLSTTARVRFTVLVEIKTPDADLVLDEEYRRRTHRLGADLTAGVAQLQQQCWRWAVEGSRTDENRDRLEGAYTHEPRGILVIGDLGSLEDARTKIMTFESFRRNLRQPEVLTFDELLHRAQQLVATGEEEARPGGTVTETPTSG